MADEPTAEVRVVLDLRFTPDDPNVFVPDEVMAALDGKGTIGDVALLWAGPPDERIGNVPWPRTASDEEQAQTDAALQQIAEEEDEANAEVEDLPEPEEAPVEESSKGKRK